MDVTLTDLELCQALSPEIHDAYLTALDFSHTNPDISLIQYRKLTEMLVTRIAAHSNFSFEPSSLNNLNNQITELFDSQLISHPLKGSLHDLRILGNQGAHYAGGNDSGAGGFEGIDQKHKEHIEERQTYLQEQAQEARKLAMTVLKDTYSILNPNKRIKDVSLSTVNDQRQKEALFEGISSLDPAKKKKAALICEGLLHEVMQSAGFIFSTNVQSHANSLRLQAVSLYEAAALISANIDNNVLGYNSEEVDKVVRQFATPEELYSFSDIVLTHEGLEHLEDKATKWLKASADRKYPPAAALYGNILLNENDKRAYQYLIQGAEAEDPLALRSLFFYYSDNELTKPDPGKALDYIKQACDLGCPDAIANLGVAYHKGVIVEKDEQRAVKLLDEAGAKGSIFAKQYKLVAIDGFLEKIQERTQELTDSFEKLIESIKPEPIVETKPPKRNDPCPCKSGKKYKKCHGSPNPPSPPKGQRVATAKGLVRIS